MMVPMIFTRKLGGEPYFSRTPKKCFVGDHHIGSFGGKWPASPLDHLGLKQQLNQHPILFQQGFFSMSGWFCWFWVSPELTIWFIMILWSALVWFEDVRMMNHHNYCGHYPHNGQCSTIGFHHFIQICRVDSIRLHWIRYGFAWEGTPKIDGRSYVFPNMWSLCLIKYHHEHSRTSYFSLLLSFKRYLHDNSYPMKYKFFLVIPLMIHRESWIFLMGCSLVFMGFSGFFPADLGTFQVLNATAICLTFAVFLFGLVVSQVKFGCRSG